MRITIIEPGFQLSVYVAARSGKLKPNLSFTGFTFRIVQFQYEGFLISAFSPSLNNIGTNGS